jgi:hypothetical protein
MLQQQDAQTDERERLSLQVLATVLQENHVKMKSQAMNVLEAESAAIHRNMKRAEEDLHSTMNQHYTVSDVRRTAKELPAAWLSQQSQDPSRKTVIVVDFNLMEEEDVPSSLKSLLGDTPDSSWAALPLHFHLHFN